MRLLTNFLLALCCSLLILAPAASAEKIKVVTRNVEPFSFESNGKRVGYSMELWDAVAREAGLEYDVVPVNSAQDMIDALKDKTADAGVAALSVTSARREVVDFTQPFYDSGLQILVTGGGGSAFDSVKQIAANLFNLQVIGGVIGLVILMLIVSHIVWVFEHRVNGEMWPSSYLHGMWESFWWTISILLVGGADNKGPVGVGGRVIAILWMFLSIILISLLTASFTTILTVNSLKGDINGPGDLPGLTVATIGGSTAEKWLTTNGATPLPCADVPACIVALKSGKAKAVVYDSPILLYALNKSQDSNLQMTGPVFENQNYAIALQQNSPLRERVDRALLAVTERGLRDELRKKWFGTGN